MRKLLFIPAMALVVGFLLTGLNTTTANAREYAKNLGARQNNSQKWYGERGNRSFTVPPGHTAKARVRNDKHNDRFDNKYSSHKNDNDHIWYHNGYDHKGRDYRHHDYDSHRYYSDRGDGLDFFSLNVILPGMNLLFGSVR